MQFPFCNYQVPIECIYGQGQAGCAGIGRAKHAKSEADARGDGSISKTNGTKKKELGGCLFVFFSRWAPKLES